MKSYDFAERQRFSYGKANRDDVGKILKENVPACIDVMQATETEDRNGTDWWCVRKAPLRNLSVDVKARDLDPVETFGTDDLALETWSVLNSKPGWTRDANKQTDYVLWMFPTGRWVLIPFPMLCAVFAEKWQAWREKYKTRVQDSGTWQSECVFVPRREVWAELYRRYGGSP